MAVGQRNDCVWKIQTFIVDLRTFIFFYLRCGHCTFFDGETYHLFLFSFWFLKLFERVEGFDSLGKIIAIHAWRALFYALVFFIGVLTFKVFKIFFGVHG